MSSLTRTFGIELEVTNPVGEVAQVLRAAGIRVQAESYNHDTRPHWKVVTDGSVTGGAEVVSPVLHGEEGIAEARRVAEALTAADIRVDMRCGFHVHIGADDLGRDAVANLVKRYAAWEAQIDAMMPRSRRGSANSYCTSAARDVLTVEAAQGDAKAVAMAIARAQGHRARYNKLNLQSLLRYGTVEFRQHSGTVDADKIENWVRFCAAFVDATAKPKAGGTGYEPRADYVRKAKRTWAEVIEQVQAAGASMEVVAKASKTYRIAGPGGSATVTTRELLALYTSPRSFDLEPARFAAFWAARVAPVLGGTDAPDTLFAGVPETVAAFLRQRAASLSGAAI